MRTSGFFAKVLFLCAVGLALESRPAIGQLNQFEIREPKVEKGEFEIELLGDYSFGPPRRRFIETAPGSFLLDDNGFDRQRHALEFGYGLTNWLNLRVV